MIIETNGRNVMSPPPRVLWANRALTSAFASQTIALDVRKFTNLYVAYIPSTSMAGSGEFSWSMINRALPAAHILTYQWYGIITKDDITGPGVLKRSMTVNSDGTITFGEGQIAVYSNSSNSNTSGTNNIYIIPYAIIGV